MSDTSTSKATTTSHIPSEILSEIFLHCLSMQGNNQKFSQRLSRVCKLWRALVYTLPALWASFHVRCDFYTLHPQLPTILTHLQRSGIHPLSFSLNAPDCWQRPHYGTNARFPAVLAALVTAHNRWCRVTIMLSKTTQETLDLITQGDAPLLQSFHCEIHKNRQVLPIPLRVLQGCPRLESLTWVDSHSPLLQSLRDTTWLQLTSLCLRAILSVADCLIPSRLSPRLTIAQLSVINSPGAAPSTRLSHPVIHTLRAEGTHITTLLSALTLPTLVNLDLKALHSTHFLPTDTILCAFIFRSTPQLRTLSPLNLHLTELELLHVLACVEGLDTFAVTEDDPSRVPLTAVLVRALHPLSPSEFASTAVGPLCRHLRTLRITNALDLPDGACGTMGADARANQVACLETVHSRGIGEGVVFGALRRRAGVTTTQRHCKVTYDSPSPKNPRLGTPSGRSRTTSVGLGLRN